MIIVSYYTEEYKEVAMRLKASLERFGLDHDLQYVESYGSWQKNTGYKPKFIRAMMAKHPGEKIVWIDADAVVNAPPVLFYRLNCDVAVHRYTRFSRGVGEVLSGTVFFGPDAAFVVDAWILEQEANPEIWDQKNLARALNAVKCTVKNLPPEYCYIFDLSKRHYPGVVPVIEHFQASRQFKER